jgi:AAA family ATP:ADP antiporter
MPDPGRRPVNPSLLTASACAFAIIATQVAGKATRDTLFLTNFDISALPLALMVSALVSIGAVLLTARAMTVLGPFRVMPPLFLVSGLLLVGEWLLAMHNVKLASVLVYLHIAVLGSILISGFWSVINEHFDPRTARRSIARIAGGATAGGLFGGFLADRVGSWAGMLSVLPLIAGLHMVCAFLLPRLKSADTAAAAPPLRAFFARSGTDRSARSGLTVLRRVGYLRNLALIVFLGNVAATLIDFLFKARATASFADSADLMRFFALFYTAVALVTLAVQAGMTRRLLERIGIANTMAVRPAVMTVGGLVTLPLMGLIGLGILRGVEAVLQSSFFRSGYELLFTPVLPEHKRATKTFIDVGADRMGDIVGGGVIRAVILLPAALSGQVLVVLAVAVSILGFGVARALRKGYVRALEESLINRAGVLKIEDAASTRTTMMESFAGLDLSMSIDGIRLEDLRAAAADAAPDAPTLTTEDAAPPAIAPSMPRVVADPEVAILLELRSGDAKRVHAALRDTRSFGPIVAGQVISLLAWDEVTGWASRALAKAAPSITGQLIDRLLDPGEDFAIRRRIPRVLSTCATPRAFDGLMAALDDKRFEVRFQSGLAMARIRERVSPGPGDDAAIYAAVLRETLVKKQLWEDQRVLDEPEGGDTPAIIGEALRVRASRSTEHVFTLLSLVLPRAPLQIAFKGLLTDDAVLRGTGLEYLESMLPREVWNSLRPYLEGEGPGAGEFTSRARPREEVLEDLLRSSQSIDLNLAELRKRITEP